MRLVSFAATDSSPRVGVVIDEGAAQVVVELTEPLASVGAVGMEELVDLDGPVWPRMQALMSDGAMDSLPRHAIDAVRLLPPVTRPFQMLFVRANYPSPEGVVPSLDRPAFFSKVPSALVGQGDAIELPSISHQVDWEGELALVIGRHASHVSQDDALHHVAGYTITNDITARDLQASGEQALAKNFRTFAPLGPWIVTHDEVEDPHDLAVKQWINGTLFQDGRTSQMVFDIPDIIAFLSSVTDLHPGDVVATGAPAGTGKQQSPPLFLGDGDSLLVEVEGIGQLGNRAVAALPRV